MPAMHGTAALRLPWLFLLAAVLCTDLVSSEINIDGGRSELPGMKQDMFDQVKKKQKMKMGKGPPDCPKSDSMTPFTNLAFVGTDIFVRLDATEGPCHKLISVGGANFTDLYNASRSCGPPGEWKRRIAEEMSAVFFQGGMEWPKNDNETMEVETEEGNFTTTVSEEKFVKMMECWKQSCGCEQAKNPEMKIFWLTLLFIALGGLSWDSIKVAIENIKGKKPPKHVICKKDHRMNKGDRDARRLCDICRKSGTEYACTAACDYDLCEKCYQEDKKKVKAAWKTWCKTHPEDKKKKKSGGEEDDDDDEKEDQKSGSESGANDKTNSETEGSKDDSEAEKKSSDKSGDEQ